MSLHAIRRDKMATLLVKTAQLCSQFLVKIAFIHTSLAYPSGKKPGFIRCILKWAEQSGEYLPQGSGVTTLGARGFSCAVFGLGQVLTLF